MRDKCVQEREFSSFLKIASAEAVQVKGFSSVRQLKATIDAYLAEHNKDPTPFPDGCFRSDTSEETLDHVEPGTASRSEVRAEAWTAWQPAMGLSGFLWVA